MKKDKALNKIGRLGIYHFQINETKTTSGETSIRLAIYRVIGELSFLGSFNRYSAKQLRKFIKALKKGLRILKLSDSELLSKKMQIEDELRRRLER